MAAKDTSMAAKVAESFNRHAGNISAVARELKRTRATVQEHVRKMGWTAKPLVAGQVARTEAEVLPLPPPRRIRRYLLTSAQNNTAVNERVWSSLNALAEHYSAAIMVGTFTYNTNAYGALSVKRGTKKERIMELWYDPRLVEHIVDTRVEIAPGLVWCGEMNMLPTAANPLEGLETYSHRQSSIFPHAKLAMRSVASMQGEPAKLIYTTGAVTVHNYIQKKEGLKAEHHHSYSALLVEVNDEGHWWVRQVCADDQGRMQDLDVSANGDAVTQGCPVEAVNWGDLHATDADEEAVEASLSLLDKLKPRFQFVHDVFEGASFNRHQVKDKNPHWAYYRWLRGLHRVDAELSATADMLRRFSRPFCAMVVPDSNHDGWWLKSWLAKYDYRADPANSEFFLKMQAFMYAGLKTGKMPRDVDVTGWALHEGGLAPGTAKFLLPDESFKVCGGKIECGMHGHLGQGGARGNPRSLSKVGRRANVGHFHAAGIWDGLYVAGTMSRLKNDWNLGPSDWTHSHVLTYPNGKRAIITFYAGKWHA